MANIIKERWARCFHFIWVDGPALHSQLKSADKVWLNGWTHNHSGALQHHQHRREAILSALSCHVRPKLKKKYLGGLFHLITGDRATAWKFPVCHVQKHTRGSKRVRARGEKRIDEILMSRRIIFFPLAKCFPLSPARLGKHDQHSVCGVGRNIKWRKRGSKRQQRLILRRCQNHWRNEAEVCESV